MWQVSRDTLFSTEQHAQILEINRGEIPQARAGQSYLEFPRAHIIVTFALPTVLCLPFSLSLNQNTVLARLWTLSRPPLPAGEGDSFAADPLPVASMHFVIQT